MAFAGLGAVAGLAQAQQTRPSMIQIGEGVGFRAPSGWIVDEPAYRDAALLTKLAGEAQNKLRIAHLTVTTEPRRSHEDALERLREIAGESTASVTVTTVAGWPAIERQEVVVLPHPERDDKVEKVEKEHEIEPRRGIEVTVAVAVDAVVVRFEGATFSDRDKASADEMRRVAPTLTAVARPDPRRTSEEVRKLRTIARPALPKKGGGRAGNLKSALSPAAAPAPLALAGGPAAPSAQVQFGRGELEVAVSNGGKDVVIAANSGWSHSHDGGSSFAGGGGTPGTFPRDGDPSLAVGRSGNFYYAFVGYPDGSAGAGGVKGCADSVARSTDGGDTFPFLSHAVFCPFTAASLCFPDQEHIAADRFNAPTGDQLYVVWRQFSPAGSPADCSKIGSGFVTPSIVCSSDGGTNWSAPAVVGTGDRPRVAVGKDGAVYVTFRADSSVMLRKFSSCSAGLVPQPAVVVDAAAPEVACPMAGLDRCNSFSSPTVATDELDANHLYLGYAINTSPSNDDMIVRHSTNGGAVWSAPVTLNAGVTGRRFLPRARVLLRMTCSVCGTAQAGWYDRRAASAAAPDLTDYFRGVAAVGAGTLQAGGEVNLTGAPDPQCATGFPCSVDAPGGSSFCNPRPLAGRCLDSTGAGSSTPCDFVTTVCPAGESCRALGGCPKYGDYNGIGCGFGRVYTAWASATPPAGTTATGSGLRIFSHVDVVCPMPKIQVPGAVHLGNACVGATSVGSLDVCNTGTADLVVSAVTSSNPRFSVTAPSGGYPLTIGHPSCFPFQVMFAPLAAGPQSATLTIASNDPTTPTKVTASASGTEREIRVTGSTDFGVASAWTPAEKTVEVCNIGTCNLSVTAASISCSDFTLIANPFPATLIPGSCLDLVVRFTPHLAGAAACQLQVASDDPSQLHTRTVTARTPPFFSLHGGWVHPHGALHAFANDGSTLNLDFVYPFAPQWAWDVRLGYSRFDGRGAHGDTGAANLSTNAKFTVNPLGAVRLFLNGGFGLYHFVPGDFEGGGNLGLGLDAPLGRRFVLEAAYNYHSAFTATPKLNFSQVQLGLLISF